MEKLTVERTIWINAPRERVWEAITTTEQLQQWWGGGDTWEIVALEVGGRVNFGSPMGMMHATISVLEPPRQFSIHWPPQPEYYNFEIVTTYTLEEENGGTRVTVTETGYEALPEDVRQQPYDSTMKGYETVLNSLRTFVESAVESRS